MLHFRLATGACLVALLMALPTGDALGKDEFVPPPGCMKRWSELAAFEASLKGERKIPFAQWLFEPLVEDGVGITRAGVTVALIAETKWRGQKCGTAPSPPGVNFEVRVCASR